MKITKNFGGTGTFGTNGFGPLFTFCPPTRDDRFDKGNDRGNDKRDDRGGHDRDGDKGHDKGHCDWSWGDKFWDGKGWCDFGKGKDWGGKDWGGWCFKDWIKDCDPDDPPDNDDGGCTPPPVADTDTIAPGGNFAGTALDEVIRGAAGVAHVIAGREGADVLVGAELADFLLGNDGNDSLFGMDGNDTLFGGMADDTICGGKGDDRIDGDQGSDVLTGAAGADVFEFNGNKADGGIDTITDFNAAEDRIEVVNSTGLTATTVQQGDDVLLTITNAQGVMLHQAVIEDALLAQVNAHLTLV